MGVGLKIPVVLWFAAGLCDLQGQEALLLYRRADLELAKERLAAGDEVTAAAYQDVLDDARKWLQAERYSVVDKDLLPESGDRHDYLSVAPYWWPNPETEDGLPYIRRDGEVNPASRAERAADKERLLDFTGGVQTLVMAWYFSGEKAYAEKAGEMLRVWFLNKDTRMNPNLEHAQLRRGHKTGRSGVLEGRAFFRVLDSSRLLSGAPGWPGGDASALRKWFEEYLDWLVESEMGRWESESPNNHGTWYDAQVLALALYVGDEEIARGALGSWRGRWDSQIADDGSQPLELNRTLSLDYSIFNLVGHFYAWRLAERLGGAPGSGGKDRLEEAIDFLTPALYGESKWKGKQIKPLKTEPLLELVRFAERTVPSAIDEEKVAALAPQEEDDREAIRESRFQLLLPRLD